MPELPRGAAPSRAGLIADCSLWFTDQEKAILYQNAINYAEQNNLQLGDALSQTQVNALTQPMLWYVQQSVPDPGCISTGVVTCPTVIALMPQVYLPPDWSAMSAGGNIAGQDVTLNFNQDGQGSILNTGNIAASNTLTVNTGTLTNQANQVNVGDIWQYIAATGYEKTSGTTVQPGGFMSAADMNLNVQTLNQIGGALQVLGNDGTVDQAGTQQFITNLQQQLGTNFTQTAVSDHLDTSFTAMGGFGLSEIVGLAFAVVVSIMSFGAASAAIGAAAGAEGGTFVAATAATTTAEGVAMPAVTAGLGNLALSAGFAGFTSSIASQLTMTGQLNWANAFEAAGVAAITAGLTNGITYNSSSGLDFTTQPVMLGQGTNSLASLAGVNPAIGNNANQATASTASTLEQRGLAILAEAGITAGVGTTIEGGSLANAFTNALTGELAASGAYAIGDAQPDLNEFEYIAAHAALGCTSSAALGTGCASGAIGGASSALISPFLVDQAGGAANLTDPDRAMITAIAMLSGGTAAGLLGQNPTSGATSAENEALNNSEAIHNSVHEAVDENKKEMSQFDAHAGMSATEIEGFDRDGNPIVVLKPAGGSGGGGLADGLSQVWGKVGSLLGLGSSGATNSASYSGIGSTGIVGESALQQLGGTSQYYFSTSLGGRYVDQLVDDVANESKVGYTSLTQSVQTQIAKDTELLQTGNVQGVTWNFFTSPVTGRGGPSGPLYNALQNAGFGVVINK